LAPTVFEHDPATRMASTHATPPAGLGGSEPGPHALQILTTEHWSLLAARSMGYGEAMSRASMFIAALSGAVVALALVAQATDFGGGFVAFALVLLPVVFFIGVATIARLGQINHEDAVWVQGMNRLRHAYLELAPELGPYFVTSHYDDGPGLLTSMGAGGRFRPPFQAFVAVPGVVAVLNSVVAGAAAGIAVLGADLGAGASVAVGVVAFGLTLGGFVVFGVHTIRGFRHRLVARFPTPPSGVTHGSAGERGAKPADA
jgi:hypothetical protein